MTKQYLITTFIIFLTISFAQDTTETTVTDTATTTEIPEVEPADSQEDITEELPDTTTISEIVEIEQVVEKTEDSSIVEVETKPVIIVEDTVSTEAFTEEQVEDVPADVIMETPELVDEEIPEPAESAETDVVNLIDLMPEEIKAELLSVEAFENAYFEYLTLLDKEEPKEIGGLFGMLGGSESIVDKKLDEYLRYLRNYYPDHHSDIIQTYIINSTIGQEKWNRAFSELIKFLHLYPKSEKWNSIRSICQELIESEKYFREESDIYKPIIDNIEQISDQDIHNRYFIYLKILKSIKKEDYNKIYISEMNRFVGLYPNGDHTSEVVLWLAKAAYKQEKYHTSYLEYEKILTFYPQSEYLPIALYKRGRIQSKHFEEYANAIATFREFLLRFSSDSLAESAQLNIARIADTKLKDWVQAVDEYQLFADTYPVSPNATTSLMRLGEIQSEELNQINESISTYDYLIQLYSQSPEAVEALVRSGNIYEADKQYHEAAEKYFTVYQSYPQSEQALPALEKCLELYEKRIKDTSRVKEILQILVDEFTESKAGKSAKKKLDKM